MKNKILIVFLILQLVIIISLGVLLFVKPNSNILEYDSEIEKKWLIKKEDIPYDLSKAVSYEIEQTYINFSPEIRIRKIDNSEHVLTFKADTAIKGLARKEHEYTITEEEYNKLLLKKEGNTISKTRYRVYDENDIPMEIDVFFGDLEGLAYLEIEFPDVESSYKFEDPSWITKDVTTDSNYKNGSLARFGIPSSYEEYMKDKE